MQPNMRPGSTCPLASQYSCKRGAETGRHHLGTPRRLRRNPQTGAYAEEQVITAPWALKWVTAFITRGTSDKGPWTQIVVVFELQHAFGEDRAEIEAELDMDD
jgi:hypothetical protein